MPTFESGRPVGGMPRVNASAFATKAMLALAATTLVATASACGGDIYDTDAGHDAGDGGIPPVTPPQPATCNAADDGGLIVCPASSPVCLTSYDSITGPWSYCISLAPCGNTPTCACFEEAGAPPQCNNYSAVACKITDAGIHLGCSAG